MRKRQMIVIFVKAPIPGCVKTRLAAKIGAGKAAGLYRVMARETYRLAQTIPDTEVWVAYQPHPNALRPTWLTESRAWFPQRGRHLGERLLHAFAKAFQENSGPVIVIGSDLPTLTTSLLENAFRALATTPVVIGPSQDGGYYLIGLRSPQPQLFREISWSSRRVFRQTVTATRKSKLPCRRLPTQQDIDTIQDVNMFKKRMIKHPSMNDFRRTRAFLETC